MGRCCLLFNGMRSALKLKFARAFRWIANLCRYVLRSSSAWWSFSWTYVSTILSTAFDMAFRCDRDEWVRLVARSDFNIVSSARRNGFVPHRCPAHPAKKLPSVRGSSGRLAPAHGRVPYGALGSLRFAGSEFKFRLRSQNSPPPASSSRD
jgi:hypothetical protein